jgi:hypothetical protein
MDQYVLRGPGGGLSVVGLTRAKKIDLLWNVHASSSTPAELAGQSSKLYLYARQLLIAWYQLGAFEFHIPIVPRIFSATELAVMRCHCQADLEVPDR